MALPAASEARSVEITGARRLRLWMPTALALTLGGTGSWLMWVASNDPRGGEWSLVIAVLMTLLSVLLGLPFFVFAAWLPIATRLSATDEAISVWWWSIRPRHREIPRASLLRIEVVGRVLRLVPRGEPPVVVRVPRGDRPAVRAWAEAIDAQRPERPDSRLDRMAFDGEGSGLSLRIRPLFAPFPPWLAALVAFFVWGFVQLWAFVLGAGLVPGLGLAGVAMLLALGWSLSRVVRLDLALAEDHLEAVVVTRWGEQSRRWPLSALTGARAERGRLVLHTEQGEVRIPMPERDPRTVVEVIEAIEQHIRPRPPGPDQNWK